MPSSQIPPELGRELRQSKRLQKFFESLDRSSRQNAIRPVQDANKPDTRLRRAASVSEWLMEVMEAEHELPPLISRGIARNPDARRGWERMPVSLRRKYLFHILRSPFPDTWERTLRYALKEFARSVGSEPKNLTADSTDSTDLR
jgi:uncharacterized protein YdeI (YjbR/CyaY-like superfamily)